jgi:flagellar motor switch protein FliM
MEATFDPAQLGPLRQKARRKTSAVLSPENALAVTPFDPRQVGQPSAAQQQALEQLHQQCAQNIAQALSARLRASVEATCASVERVSGAAFLEKLPEPGCLALLGRAGGTALLQMDLSLVFPILDRILGGTGQDAAETRELTEIEQQLFEPVGHSIGQALQQAWQPVLKLDTAWGGGLLQSDAAALLPPADNLLVATFQVRVQELQGNLVLAFPSTVASALLRRLAPQESALPASAPRDRSRLQEQLLGSRLEAELLLPRSTVSIRQLCGLQPGDVVVLKVRANELLPVHVAGREMFLASPVRCGSQRGAQVQQALSIVPKKEGEGKQ